MARRKPKKARSLQKANPLGLPEIGPTTVTNGKGEKLKRTLHEARSDKDARNTQLDARCRALGLTPSQATRRTVSAPYMGDDLFRVLQADGLDHAALERLWSYWRSFCQSQRTYRSRILSVSADPKGAALTMVAERIEATPEDEPDVRTSEERDEDARKAWHRWNHIMDGGMDPSLRVALLAAERGDGPVLFREGKPTFAGFEAARALRLLADLAER